MIMKKSIIFLILSVFVLVSCNDLEDEIYWHIDTSVPGVDYIQITDADDQGYTVRVTCRAKVTEGNVSISRVFFEYGVYYSNQRIDAQKMDGDIYYADIEIPYGGNQYIETYVVIDGNEYEVKKGYTEISSMYYLVPYFDGDAYVSVQELGKVRFHQKFINKIPNKPITTAYMTLAGVKYPVSISDDGVAYADVDLYTLGSVTQANPSFTLGNEYGGNVKSTYSYSCSITTKVLDIDTDVDTSNDGKEVSGGIRLAGSIWAKGVIYKQGDKYVLDKNRPVGTALSYTKRNTNSLYYFHGAYDDPVTNTIGSGWYTPYDFQFQRLENYCSFQRVAVNYNGNVRYAYVAYPSKNKKRVICEFYGQTTCVPTFTIAQYRDKGLYLERVKENADSYLNYCYYASSTVERNASYPTNIYIYDDYGIVSPNNGYYNGFRSYYGYSREMQYLPVGN